MVEATRPAGSAHAGSNAAVHASSDRRSSSRSGSDGSSIASVGSAAAPLQQSRFHLHLTPVGKLDLQ